MRKNQKRILVIGEMDQKDKLTSLTSEIIGGARKLADQFGGSVDLMLITSGKEIEHDAIRRGVDRVYIATNPEITTFDLDAVTAVASDVCRKSQLVLCLMGQRTWEEMWSLAWPLALTQVCAWTALK